MIKTQLCRLLDIDYPIVQAGMAWLANAELAAAVSNAGGLGVVTANAGLSLRGDPVKNLRAQVRRVRSLTDKPFGVSLFANNPDVKRFADVVVAEGAPVVLTGGGSPAPLMEQLDGHGIKVLHLVGSVRHARAAEALGVDAVVAEGLEGGGVRGNEEASTLVLVPQLVEAVEIPVVASGGIVDARGLVAALALGAAGVCMGTRFVATQECVAHPRYKEAVVGAIETSTAVVRTSRVPIRVLKTEAVNKWLRQAENGKAPPWEEISTPERLRKAYLEGDLTQGIAYAGAGAGLIGEVAEAGELVKRIMREADALVGKLR